MEDLDFSLTWHWDWIWRLNHNEFGKNTFIVYKILSQLEDSVKIRANLFLRFDSVFIWKSGLKPERMFLGVRIWGHKLPRDFCVWLIDHT